MLRDVLGLDAALAHRGAGVGAGFVGRVGADLVVNSSSLGNAFLNGVNLTQLWADVYVEFDADPTMSPRPLPCALGCALYAGWRCLSLSL